MNQGIYGLTQASGRNPSLEFSTTEDTQAGISSSRMATPQSVRDAIVGWWSISHTGTAATNSGSAAAGFGNAYLSLATTTTINGTSLFYVSTPASSYLMQGTYSSVGTSAKNWGVPQWLFVRLARGTSATNSVLRVQWGEKATVTTFAQMNGRGIGCEIRDARLWIIAHNGSDLTQYDTGINVNGGQGTSAVPFDLLITSNVGIVSVQYTNAGRTLVASTPGGPINRGTNTTFPTIELTNGASATACQFYTTIMRGSYT